MAKLTRQPDTIATRSTWPPGGGEVGELIRNLNWEDTPLGPPSAWPLSLRWATELVLASTIPRAVLWGTDFVQIYNDSFSAAFMEGLHPAALGQRTKDCRPEAFPRYEPYYARVLSGESLVAEDLLTPMQRNGRAENVWITITCTPLRDDADAIAGILISAFETTQHHLAEVELRARREQQAFLLQLSDALRPLQGAEEIKSVAARILGEYLHVDNVYYADIERNDEYSVNSLNYYSSREGPDIANHYHFSDYSRWIIDELHAAHLVAVGDVRTDPRYSKAERARYARVQVQAFVAIPLMKSGRLAAILGVTQFTARAWSREDLILIEETAERTWAAVERAIAEAQLAADLRDTQLLRDLGARLVIEGNTQILYEEILSAAIALAHADAGTVQILDHAKQTLVLSASRGFEQTMTAHLRNVDASSYTSCGLTLASGARAVIDYDVPEAKDPDGTLRLHLAAGYRSGQSTPLVSRSGQAVGMVSTHWRERHRPSERESRYLDLLARQAADVIERLQTEVALRTSKSRLQATMEQAAVGIVETGLDHRILRVNPGFCRILGYSHDEALQLLLEDTTHPDDLPADQQMFARLLNGEIADYTHEKRCLRKDGTPIWVLVTASMVPNAQGAPDYVVAIIQDIDARKQAEAALRESEERFRTFVDLVPDLLWRHDIREAVTWYNRRWIEYTGQPSTVTRNTMGFDFIHPDDREALMADFGVASEASRPFQSERRIRRADGAYRWFLVHGEPVLDADGQIVQWFGAATDTHERHTERDELAERVSESTAQLRELSRELLQVQEEERRHLARELHDEIGQVLTGLQFQLASAARHGSLDSRGLMEAETIVRDLTSRVSALSMDLRPAVLDALGLLPALLWHVERYQARTGITVHVRHQGIDRRFPPSVEITAYRVVQEALTNVARHADARTVNIQLLADEGVLTVAIRDDGVGFIPKQIEVAGGLGGLRERVALQGGNVVIESKPGVGTLIMSELPLPELENATPEVLP
jgi:PAS domain S-box-containing protein